jgi:hypothetical protein
MGVAMNFSRERLQKSADMGWSMGPEWLWRSLQTEVFTFTRARLEIPPGTVFYPQQRIELTEKLPVELRVRHAFDEWWLMTDGTRYRIVTLDELQEKRLIY